MTSQSTHPALTAGLIDVFAETALSGNPLAVVEDADKLSDAQMRSIAREFNQAETTFIMKSDRADYRLRSFTAAGAEVVGAGHNALGAWLWLAETGRLGRLSGTHAFRQEIGEEILDLALHATEGRISGHMRQSALTLRPPLADVLPLAAALGLAPGDLDPDLPPLVADTGVPHLLVGLRDAATVDRAEPSAKSLAKVLANASAEGCYVYALDAGTTPGHAYARFFNPTVGLWEDAATGTAAGPLAGYLASRKLIADTLMIEQGTRMGRRSIIRVRIGAAPEISGAGVVVMRGTISL